MCTQKCFTDLWMSLRRYWPLTLLCTSITVAYCHSVEFNIRLFILNPGVGYLVHSILIRQPRWHFGEQFFSDLLLPAVAVMQISWWKSQHGPIFIIKVVPKWWTMVHSSMAEAFGGWGSRREAKKQHAVFFFSLKWHLPGSRSSLPAFDIPGEAGPSYRCRAGPPQGRHTWAIGFTVNTKCKRASKSWGTGH